MSTGRVTRVSVAAPPVRSRVTRVEAGTTTVVATVRGRVSRVSLAAAPVTAIRGRVTRVQASVLPDVIVPATITSDSYNLVVMTATLSTGELARAWQWEQTAGTTVTRNGSTNVVSFNAPATTTDSSYSFRVRALMTEGYTLWKTIDVAVTRHPWWSWRNDVLRPLLTGRDRAQLQLIAPKGDSLDTSVPDDTTTPPPPPPPSGDTPDPGVFYKLPSNIFDYTRKSMAHYFPAYGESMDNQDPASDTYVRSYLKVDGTTDNTAEGGLLRDRPIVTQPKTDYMVQNARHQIANAIQAGNDGFVVDLLGTQGNLDRMAALRTAAAQYYPGQFYVAPMIDANSGTFGTTTNAQFVADYIKLFKGQSFSWTLPDGRFVISVFKCEGRTEAWWQQIMSLVGGNNVWNGIFVDWAGNSANYPNLLANAITGTFGYGGDPLVIGRAGSYASTAHSRGQRWMEAMNGQNTRPNQHWWDEAAGTEAWKQSHLMAIRTGAEFMQDITFNDYSENGQTEPSVQNGYVMGDLGAYWKVPWKTGASLAILRDAIYVSHRNQFTSGSNFQFVSTQPMIQKDRGGSITAPQNIVEIRTFLTTSRTITVTQKRPSSTDVVTTYTAPAGEFRRTVPLQYGYVIATATDGGGATTTTVTTNVSCVANPVVQDLNYFRWSSLRPTSTYLTPLSHL